MRSAGHAVVSSQPRGRGEGSWDKGRIPGRRQERDKEAASGGARQWQVFLGHKPVTEASGGKLAHVRIT